jgi:hypothetical protein
MLDLCFPTTDGRWLIMPRYTQPTPEQQILLHTLKLNLPAQPRPGSRSALKISLPKSSACRADLFDASAEKQGLSPLTTPEVRKLG